MALVMAHICPSNQQSHANQATMRWNMVWWAKRFYRRQRQACAQHEGRKVAGVGALRKEEKEEGSGSMRGMSPHRQQESLPLPTSTVLHAHPTTTSALERSENKSEGMGRHVGVRCRHSEWLGRMGGKVEAGMRAAGGRSAQAHRSRGTNSMSRRQPPKQQCFAR